ncbi:MAG: flagellar motor switch protein FliG [Candidatus Magnetoglobus multicellularis str. Araruama]|uniref:Flagellar motor switch protein FliG n=1 Tax=Candidatus Magnetoglobus multicellularis str. Araruama TaxID=890399 RepID=A0A1V1P475_9BACT|nr:MAG: flagellar motor switch protein FliG [Candidatus Magnetoglobus multicellularis str. Araruama]
MVEHFKGRRKAAILLVTLGHELSAEIFKNLTQQEIEEITLEIANLRTVDPTLQYKVTEEFYHLTRAKEYLSRGGVGYAMEILDRALGTDKAKNIINGLSNSLQTNPFEFIKRADPAQIINFIEGEQPQTIALILAYLPSNLAAQIMSSLSSQMQAEVAKRIATMEETSPDVVTKVEMVLEEKLSKVLGQDFAATGGVKSLVDILNKSSRATERTILDALSQTDPDLTEEVRKMMFVFEDIILLDDKSIQRVLKETDKNDLTLALKTASEELKVKIYNNISERAALTLQENMAYLGPVRLSQVESAQTRIVNIIRNLEEKEEIVLNRGDSTEELFV